MYFCKKVESIAASKLFTIFLMSMASIFLIAQSDEEEEITIPDYISDIIQYNASGGEPGGGAPSPPPKRDSSNDHLVYTDIYQNNYHLIRSKTGQNHSLTIHAVAPDGDIIWSRNLLSTGDIKPNEMFIDHHNQLVIVGQFSRDLQIEGSDRSDDVFALGLDDYFIASYNIIDGQIHWIKAFGTSGDDQIQFTSYGVEGLHLQLEITNTSNLLGLQTSTNYFDLIYNESGDLIYHQQYQ